MSNAPNASFPGASGRQREVPCTSRFSIRSSHSLGLTAIFAVLPLVVLFVLLGGFRMKAQWASLIALAVSILIAIMVYSMPIGQAGDAALEGAVFGFWPIMWIVINALWIFNMTEVTGYFAVLRRAFAASRTTRASRSWSSRSASARCSRRWPGSARPVAICGVMLVGVGFTPMRAASLALVADTAPVAFGAIAIPITTLAQVTGLPVHDLARWSDARRRSWPCSSRSRWCSWPTDARRARGVAGRADRRRRVRRPASSPPPTTFRRS